MIDNSSGKDENKASRLWSEFFNSRSAKSRNRIVMHYAFLVKYVAGRIAIGLPSYVEIDDLFSAGMLGLMQAVAKYEPERKTKFETYAVPRVRGAMLDELRAQDWFPRSVRKKAKTLEKAYAEVESRIGRSATDKEIAGFLKIPLADYYDLLDDVCLVTLISLDKEISNCNEGLYAVISEDNLCREPRDPLQLLEQKELHELVKEVVHELPEKERLVLTLYYYEELTLKEIGEILYISESRVCQIHTKATMRLKGRLAQHTQTLSVKHIISKIKSSARKKDSLSKTA